MLYRPVTRSTKIGCDLHIFRHPHAPKGSILSMHISNREHCIFLRYFTLKYVALRLRHVSSERYKQRLHRRQRNRGQKHASKILKKYVCEPMSCSRLGTVFGFADRSRSQDRSGPHVNTKIAEIMGCARGPAASTISGCKMNADALHECQMLANHIFMEHDAARGITEGRCSIAAADLQPSAGLAKLPN